MLSSVSAYFLLTTLTPMTGEVGEHNPKHVYNLTVNNEHMKTVLKTAKNICYLIIRTIIYKTHEIMLPLDKALVHLSLEYGNSVWCPYKKKDIDDHQDIQRFFSKRIIGCSNLLETYWIDLENWNYPVQVTIGYICF